MKSDNARTAFHLACLGGYLEIAEMIVLESILFNIDLNAKDTEGATAFHLACKRNYVQYEL